MFLIQFSIQDTILYGSLLISSEYGKTITYLSEIILFILMFNKFKIIEGVLSTNFRLYTYSSHEIALLLILSEGITKET